MNNPIQTNATSTFLPTLPAPKAHQSHRSNKTKHSQAVRLVSTQAMPREEWLRVRNQGIGASDAAAAVGLNPYQSPLELWMVKTGRMAATPMPEAGEGRSPMHWGTVLEPLVAKHYSEATGRKVRRVNAVLQHQDPDKHWMLANLDYAVAKDEEVQILECKTAGEFGAKLWKEGVPDYVQCQVQHQLAVTGDQAADVAVLICGQEFRIFRVERDEGLIAQLIELERQFWHWVETDTPPPADGSESALRALQALFPKDDGEILDLADDDELSGTLSQLEAVRQQLKALQAEESRHKQTLQQALGDASGAELATGRISWKRSKDSITTDLARLSQDHPKLIDAYQLTRPGSRRFLVHSY